MQTTATDRDGWFAEVRARGVAEVAQAFGLTFAPAPPPGSLSPCPACGEERRGKGDRRGPAGVTRDGLGWHCHRCGAKGSALDIALWRVLGKATATGQEWGDIRRACADSGLCEPDPATSPIRPAVARKPLPAPKPPAPPMRPPAAEVEALWGACVRVDRTLVHPDPADSAATDFLRARGFFPMDVAALDVARLLPLPEQHAFPAWWPSSWARTWRLVVPAHEANGTLASLHARRIDGGDKPKTRWPRHPDYPADSYEASGLLMAGPAGRAFLRGEVTPAAVIVAEGLTDLIAWSLWSARTGRGWPVLAVTSGGARAFAHVAWPAVVPCYVATDNDRDGDKYAAEVRAALPARVSVRRVKLSAEG